MGEQEQSAPVPEGRVATGTETLDAMLHGGLLGHRPYLIVGPSGTGKTTLALQFLCEGVRRGERCLIVTLEEPPNEMRTNHRSLLPELDAVYVFDAIPDVMRYERAPFKDIAAVRQSVPFSQIPTEIRKTPELSSVEVTFTALEQTLKMEMARRNFQRIVIDSLTALQYFCMKGFDETLGAQTFLRFLSDLRVTTLLTVEAPLEDSETPERLLARGEVRLFRWEHDARTVRAIGVEKFRGSEHDGRLHPYRISPKGLDVNLALTISRDTQELMPSTIEPMRRPSEPPEPPEVFETSLASLEQDSRDLIAVGVDVGAVRSTVLEALAASERSTAEEVARIVARARGRVLELVSRLGENPPSDGSMKESPAMRRLRARLAAARMGIPPSGPPDLNTLRPMLEKVLDALEPPGAAPRPVPAISPRATTVPPPPRAPAGAPARAPMAPEPLPVAPPITSTPSTPAVRISTVAQEPGPTPAAPPVPTTGRPTAPLPVATPPTSIAHEAEVSAVPAAPSPTPALPSRSVPRPAPPGMASTPPRLASSPPAAHPSGSAPAARSTPPPLPSLGKTSSTSTRSERKGPAATTTSVGEIAAPSASEPAPSPAAVEASAPAEAPAGPKRRRRSASSAAVPRKRSPKSAKASAEAATPPAASPSDGLTGAPAFPTEVGGATPAAEPPVPKPKRRASRRKAPPVTAAEPGSPPPAEERVASVDVPAPPPPPPTTDPPPPDSANPDGA